ncbi:MAG: glycerol-3-phosphate 1-O-acyltransferase PlsY [Nitrospiraceae bacterium]|nr:glycerol-3-phosphate 1-O-acyltransferase PlsY [Nitrospiraceae bacterium]
MVSLSQIIWPILAYLIGSIPFGLVLAHARGIDLRKYGSGNIGATNVARVTGKGWGLLTLVADLSKGLLPVIACKYAVSGSPDPYFWIACTGLAAVLGHCYSIFLGLHGGKGVATATGVFLGICPKAVGIATVIFVLVVKKWGYVSLGSLTTAALMPILLYLFCPTLAFESMALGIAIVIWIRHRDNIKRLIRSEEKGWRKA